MYPWHKKNWQYFCDQQQQQRLPHALLLTGFAGLGKQAFANAVIANVLCTSLQDNAMPCGQCHSCQLLSAGNHPDHILITPEESGKQIKIDQIRNLKEKQQLTTGVADWKTIIISPAESMNISASNSLLKLLEEPQQNTLLILISNNPEKLPITIRSRCQNYHFISPPTDQTLSWLEEQGIQKQPNELEIILQLAKGAPIKVLEMIDNQVNDQYQQLERDFDALLTGQANPITLTLSWQKIDLTQILNYFYHLIQSRIIELMKKQQYNTKNRYYFELSDCITQTIKLLSSSNNINKSLLTEEFIVSILQITQPEYKVR